MRTRLSHSISSLKLRRQRALTLLEIIVATGLLVIIVLGLTAMFIQTQKAFRSGLKQGDILEGARAVADMMARDLEKLADCQLTDTNLILVNFSSFLVPTNTTVNYEKNSSGTLVPFRSNVLEDVFAVNHVNLDWTAVGYSVNNVLPGVGTLYRYSPASVRPATNLAPLYNEFSSTTNWMTNRIADGVIHLQVRAYDQRGVEITNNTYGLIGYAWPAATVLATNPPYFLELEIGMLEPQIFEQARSMGANATSYLQAQAGKIHIFRQQIPVRSALR